MKRTFFKDQHNDRKIWEVVQMVGGYYLRQYISGRQFGRGIRTTKKHIENIGIFGFEQVPGIQ